MTPRDLEAGRAAAAATLDESVDGGLALAARTEIGLAFGPSDDPSARRRRVFLNTLCIERVLPTWRDAHPDDARPERMLALAQQVLDRVIDHQAAENEQAHFDNEVGDATPRDPEGRATCVGLGAISTLTRALVSQDDYDALPPGTTEEDLDFDAWDAPYWASLATTGGLEGEPDPDLRREFWRWYLDEAVPRAANQT